MGALINNNILHFTKSEHTYERARCWYNVTQSTGVYIKHFTFRVLIVLWIVHNINAQWASSHCNQGYSRSNIDGLIQKSQKSIACTLHLLFFSINRSILISIGLRTNNIYKVGLHKAAFFAPNISLFIYKNVVIDYITMF